MCKIEKECPYYEEIDVLKEENDENDLCNGRENSLYCIDNQNCIYRRMIRAESKLEKIKQIFGEG